MHAYLFSGLGSDERVFKYLTLPENLIIHYIRWEKPDMSESIEEYAGRISTQINEPNSIFIGISFGGIVAIEVDKIIPARNIILLSSVKAASELPGFFPIAGAMGLYSLANVKLIQKESRWLFNMYGVKEDEHKELLMALFRDLDQDFFKWAVKQMMKWKHVHSSNHVIQIHGTKDKAFPFKRIKDPDHVVGEGGHFMVFDKAARISKILDQEIAKITA